MYLYVHVYEQLTMNHGTWKIDKGQWKLYIRIYTDPILLSGCLHNMSPKNIGLKNPPPPYHLKSEIGLPPFPK